MYPLCKAVKSDGDMIIVHTKSSMMTMRQSVKKKKD